VGGELSICVLSAEEQDLTQDLSTTHYHMLIPLNIFFLNYYFLQWQSLSIDKMLPIESNNFQILTQCTKAVEISMLSTQFKMSHY